MTKTYIVTVSSLPDGDEESSTLVYQQVVETINLPAVIEAVNAAPKDPLITIIPAPRKRKPRSDKGRPRKWDEPNSSTKGTVH